MNRSGPRAERIALGVIGIVLFAVSWEAAARLGLANQAIVSSPTRIAAAFVQQWRSGELVAALGVSLGEFAVGFGLSLAVGVTVGLVMGMSRLIEDALDPFLWFLYAAPLIAFYPLIIVWLGFGHVTVIAVTFLLTVVSIIVNTLAGVRSVEPLLVRAVRAFGGNRRAVVTKVILPASVPLIVAGARIGLGRALLGVVLGEMFSSNAGLGFRLSFYAAHLRTADVFVSLLMLILIGVASNQLCRAIESRLQAWRG